MKYREEVYPAKLVVISFLAHQHGQGQIYKQFQEANVPDVIQVRETLFSIFFLLVLLCIFL
jgi:hypothetical protein